MLPLGIGEPSPSSSWSPNPGISELPSSSGLVPILSLTLFFTFLTIFGFSTITSASPVPILLSSIPGKYSLAPSTSVSLISLVDNFSYT